MSTRSDLDAWEAWLAFTAPHDEHLPCQDYADAFLVGGLTVLAVADGVSRAAHAAEASEAAVQLVKQVLEATGKLIWHTADAVVVTMRALMRSVGEAFLEWADAQPVPAGYATTLAIAIVYGDWVGIASVGDSFAVVYSGDASHIAMVPHRPGAANEACTVRSWEQNSQYLAIHDPDMRGVLLSTDGLERLLIDGIVCAEPGRSHVVPIMLHPGFAGVLGAYCKSMDPAVLEPLGSQDAIRLKGDDVGVSVAARHVGLVRR